ncbi:MAG: AmmeMemoRadiSam system radical SAM enzyme [Candidatus Omnitrophica bacterium]|nr:AmmeMemoRadiSam system radical SAM enzyme [Candidatus Omnitrophota bacterium]
MGFLNSKEAMFYEKLDETTIQCHLCPRNCVLKNGMRGFCKVREPHDGKHYTLVYGNPTAVHVDPIEKKPLFHFLPATLAFSIATAGCNFRCKYCQNWQISQFPPEETSNQYLPPKAAVEASMKYRCPTIAYTYSEPSIFYEYMLDTAEIARSHGLRNIYHSNGSLNPKPAEKLAAYLDGANIDLKGFTQEFYSKIPEGDLDTVLNTIKILKKNRVHVEITNLIIPSLNDDMATIRKMCKWLKSEVGKDVPVHFSRFYPTYKLKNISPTPLKTLEEARRVAMEEGLLFVYIGNVPGHEAENTYCPTDGKLLIRRLGYKILENNIVNGKCKFCQTDISGVW